MGKYIPSHALNQNYFDNAKQFRHLPTSNPISPNIRILFIYLFAGNQYQAG